MLFLAFIHFISSMKVLANRPNIIFILADDMGWRLVNYSGCSCIYNLLKLSPEITSNLVISASTRRAVLSRHLILTVLLKRE